MMKHSPTSSQLFNQLPVLIDFDHSARGGMNSIICIHESSTEFNLNTDDEKNFYEMATNCYRCQYRTYILIL